MLKYLNKILGVGYWKTPDINVVPVRIREFSELIEVLTDGCVLFPDESGNLKEYRKGTVFWHISGEETIHTTLPDELYECITFYFDVSRPERPGPRVSQWKNPDEAVRFARSALNTFHGGAMEDRIFCEYIYSTFAWNAVSGRTTHEDLPGKLSPVTGFIRKNLSSNISPKDMADRCGISLPYFHALFREHFGISPHQYLLKLRIDQAKTMLAGTQAGIKEIASSCGFDSCEVFYRRFKIETGQTPNEYRKKYEYMGY